MKLVMTLCVRNEVDIVRENLEFHLDSGVDFFIVTDNRSNDGTRLLLKSYERRGLLRYLYAPSPFFDQGEFVTNMARLAATEHGADWIINNDADEFWWTPEGDLKAAINSHCQSDNVDVLIVNRTDFVSDQSIENESSIFYQHMILRRRESTNSLLDPLPPKVLHRGDPSVVIDTGNHGASGDLLSDRRMAEPHIVEIYHFPMRSFKHLKRKATKDYFAHKKNIVFRSLSNTYREYNNLYRQGKLRDYYDNYCGFSQYDCEKVIKDNRFKERMINVMKAPTVITWAQYPYGFLTIEKLKKGLLNTGALFTHTTQFYFHLVVKYVLTKFNRTRN